MFEYKGRRYDEKAIDGHGRVFGLGMRNGTAKGASQGLVQTDERI